MTIKNSLLETLCVDVAACTRLMNSEGLIDYSGHVSARLPGGNGLLVQSFEAPRATLRPEQILMCDWEGVPLDDKEGLDPPREIYIHTEIMKTRSHVGAVAHFHAETATLFSVVEDYPLIPVKNHASRWAKGIPIHPEPSHINSRKLGEALSATLGDCHATLLRAHGGVITAETLPALLVDAIHFEENAKFLMRAKGLGQVKGLSTSEMQLFESRFNRVSHTKKLWKYFVTRVSNKRQRCKEWRRI